MLPHSSTTPITSAANEPWITPHSPITNSTAAVRVALGRPRLKRVIVGAPSDVAMPTA